MSNLDSILQERRKDEPEESGSKFYQLMRVEGGEHFLEVQFRDGIRTALSYANLDWFNYSPETNMLDLSFQGTTVSIEGRGMADLFQALKAKKVSWVKEADTELQDNESNPVFIKEITILPPEAEFQGDQNEEQ